MLMSCLEYANEYSLLNWKAARIHQVGRAGGWKGGRGWVDGWVDGRENPSEMESK